MSDLVVVGPDGSENVFPAGTSDEVIKTAMKKHYGGPPEGATENLLAAGKDIGYSAAAGLGKTMSMPARAMGAFQGNIGDLANTIRGLLGKSPQANPLAAGANQLADTNDQFWNGVGDKSRLQGYAKAGTEGAGSAMLGGGGMLAKAFTGATAGLGGEFGFNATGGTELGRMAGSILGGLGGGLASSWDKPSTAANRELARNARGIPKADWDAAEANIAKMAHSGSTTGTLAEAFPGENPLLPAAKEARKAVPDGSMAARLVHREDDLNKLGQTALGRVGPEVSAEDTTRRAMTAAGNRIDQLEGARGKMYSSLVDKARVDPQATGLLKDYLLGKAAQTQSQVEKDAYEAMAEAVTQANKQAIQVQGPNTITTTRSGFKTFTPGAVTTQEVDVPKTSVSALKKDMSQVGSVAISDTASAGKKLDQGTVNRVYQEAMGVLKTFSPELAKAESRFKDMSTKLVDPAKQGPMGQVSGRALQPNQQPTPGSAKLEQFVQDQSPADVATIARSTQKGAPEDKNLFRDISRVLMGRKIEKGSTDPGQAIRGAQGSETEDRLKALLQVGGVRNPTRALEPLEVADLLQRMNKPAEGIPNPGNTLLGGLARPFTTIARQANTEGYRNVQNQIGDLLSNPTPENLATLRKLVEQNPQLRDLLSGAGQGALTGGIVGGLK